MDCDYCGEEIAGHYVTLSLRGSSEADTFERVLEEDLHYHASERTGEDACFEQVLRVLGDFKRWATAREGSGLAWRLEEVPGAGPSVEPPVGLPEPGMPDSAEYARRVAAGTGLYEFVPEQTIQALFDANLVTLEEVARCSEDEVKAIEGVGPTTMQDLRKGMTRLGISFSEGAVTEVTS